MKTRKGKVTKIKTLTFTAFLSLLVTTTAMPLFSYATTQDDLDNTNQQIDDLNQQQDELEGNISSLNSQLTDVAADLDSINSQISGKQSEIDELTVKLAELEQSEAEQYSAMKKRIQYMYEHGTTSSLDLIFSSNSLSEVLQKSEYVEKISEYDRNMLEKLHDTYVTQSEYASQLQADKDSLDVLKANAQDKQNNLNTLVASAQTQYDSNTQNISDAEEQAKALEAQLEQERIAQEKIEREAEEEARRQEAAAAAASAGTDSSTTSASATITPYTGSYSASDVDMLAAIIECEAGGESYEGKLAVGSTVLNRVSSSRWPNSISGVIYQSGQFTPVTSGRFAMVLARGANSTCYQAAQEVLGGNITINAIFFHVKQDGETGGTVIGNHIFF